MFHITVIAVGKIKTPELKELCNEYKKRINSFAKLEVVEVEAEPSYSLHDTEKVQKKEEEKIKLLLEKRRGRVFLLSEAGEQYTSEAFAQFIFEKSEELILVIGGSFGFSAELKGLYPAISLSSMTFPHEFARVILFEQLYRSITLQQNKDKYHK